MGFMGLNLCIRSSSSFCERAIIEGIRISLMIFTHPDVHQGPQFSLIVSRDEVRY